MSWQPAEDPKPGDRFSCDAIETMIIPRSRDIGSFEVRRALPSTQRQMVGPFIFFDQMGPNEFLLGAGMDVRPHPHIGLSTVTYLFEGEIMHRDSLGTVLPIRPGELNWMTAGRGIAHSERTPPELRVRGSKLFGIQSWVALSRRDEEKAPDFTHYDAKDLPVIDGEGKTVRIIAGSLLGKTFNCEDFKRDVLRGCRRRGRRIRAARSRPRGTRDLHGRGRDPNIRRHVPAWSTARVPSGRPHHDLGEIPGAIHDAGWRTVRWPALHLVEFRIVPQGTHRPGQGRLEAGAL